MYQPETFPGQQPDESIILVLHRHWYVFVNRIIQIFLLILLPLIILAIITQTTDVSFELGTLSYTLLVMGVSLYSLFLLLLLYGYWLDYALDVFIVSNKRVVDIEQAGLFHRTVAEQRLNRVQDVTYEVKGIVRTFLKFGDVHIQTAGEKERFVFEDVANPDRVTELILRQLDTQQSPDDAAAVQPETILKQPQPVPHHQHPPKG